MENFAAYDVHMMRRELLGQNKSVLLKSPAVLELVCEDLEVNNAYDELLYAAQKGHILLRSRLFLQDDNPSVKAGVLAVINKKDFSLIKLLGNKNRKLRDVEVNRINQMVGVVFNQYVFI